MVGVAVLNLPELSMQLLTINIGDISRKKGNNVIRRCGNHFYPN